MTLKETGSTVEGNRERLLASATIISIYHDDRHGKYQAEIIVIVYAWYPRIENTHLP